MKRPIQLAVLLGILGISLASSLEAHAGRFELSGGFGFNRSDYGGESYSWNRRWGLSFGYHFSERSEIELSLQDVVDRTSIANYQEATFHDQIYTISWVQSLLGRSFVVDPYFKLGAGQTNRDASNSFVTGESQESQVDSLTVILGIGLRIKITRSLGLRCEADSYLNGGSLPTWQNNVAFNAGVSFYF